MYKNKMRLSDLVKNPEHDAYYMVDLNMVIHYINKISTKWNNYVDFLSKKGDRFYILPRIADEISQPIPPQFIVLKHNFGCDKVLHFAYSDLATQLNLTGSSIIKKFETDSKWLLESGYCSASIEEIPTEAFTNDMVYAITSNSTYLRRMIRDPIKRQKFEKVVDKHGLEHLIDIRFFDKNDETYIDYKYV